MNSKGKLKDATDMILAFRNAREHWLTGQIGDAELKKANKECDYRLLREMSLADLWTEISQVNCAREILEGNTIGGDDIASVRQYAMETHTRLVGHDEDEENARDLYCILPPKQDLY